MVMKSFSLYQNFLMIWSNDLHTLFFYKAHHCNLEFDRGKFIMSMAANIFWQISVGHTQPSYIPGKHLDYFPQVLGLNSNLNL
jgi:hypothetical protein